MTDERWSDEHIFLFCKSIAWSIVRKRNKVGFFLDVDELTQELTLALLKARRNFRPEGKMSLESYMWMKLRYAIKDSYRSGWTVQDNNNYKYLRKNGVLLTGSRFQDYDTCEGDEDDEGYNPVFAAAATRDHHFLWEAVKHILECLSERERKVIFLLHCAEKTHEEVNEITGISKPMIAKIQGRAILKCQNHLLNHAA